MNKFLRNNFGSVLILVGFALSSLVVAAGVGIDVGMATLASNKAQQAVDAAALASAIHSDTLSESDNDKLFDRYFSMNFPDTYMGSNITARSVKRTIDSENSSVEVNLENAQVQTFFGASRGGSSTDTIAFSVDATVSSGAEEINIPTNFGFALDFSGSMSVITTGPDGMTLLDSLQNSYMEVIDIILGTGGGKSPYHSVAAAYFDDELIASHDFSSIASTPKSEFLNTVPLAGGGTQASLAIQSLREYFLKVSNDRQRVLILMSDAGAFSPEAILECQAAKSEGIIVNTVMFYPSSSSPMPTTTNECASSDGHAFLATNDEELRESFQSAITGSQIRIRITE